MLKLPCTLFAVVLLIFPLSQADPTPTIQLDELEYIRVIVWSPDSSQIAVAGDPYQCESGDPAVYILDGVSLQPVTTLQSDSGCHPESLTWSPDGTMLAASFLVDGVFQTWNVQTGQTIFWASEPILFGPLKVAWNPYSNVIACSSLDGSVQYFDPLTGSRLFTGSDSAGYALDWSPDGENLVSAEFSVDNDGQSIFLNNPTNRSDTKLTSLKSSVVDLDWSPDGSKLVVGTDEGELLVWDMLQNQQLWLHTYPGNVLVWDVQWSPDSTQVASLTGTEDRVLHIFDVATEAEVKNYPLEGRVYTFAWSPDGSQILYGGDAGLHRISIE